MKRIIALSNVSNKGKTETLIEFGNLLLSQIPANDIIYCDKTITDKKLPPKEDFTLSVKFSGKTIGITSQGDPGCGLKDRLLILVDIHIVEYVFCATRTSGGTVNDVYDVSNSKDYEILWTSTYHDDKKSGIDSLNKLKAKHLLDLLQELIKQDC